MATLLQTLPVDSSGCSNEFVPGKNRRTNGEKEKSPVTCGIEVAFSEISTEDFMELPLRKVTVTCTFGEVTPKNMAGLHQLHAFTLQRPPPQGPNEGRANGIANGLAVRWFP